MSNAPDWIVTFDPVTQDYIVIRNAVVLDHVRNRDEAKELRADYEDWERRHPDNDGIPQMRAAIAKAQVQ